MRAIFLIKAGAAAKAFEVREIGIPVPLTGQVLVKVEAFGLNFADVMARKGLYKEAPPIPFIPGYDVSGTVAAIGQGVENVKTGDRVTAMTRFGGYAEYAITDSRAVAVIPASLETAAATALSTQYCTAYFAAAEMVNLLPGDKVLIQSGAGGVGTALIQYAKYRRCEIFATASTPEKLEYLQRAGVHHPINYATHDFVKEVKQITGGMGLDVVFDAVGGSSVKKGFRILDGGGRIVCYGAAGLTDKNILGKLKVAVGFGIYHPAIFMMSSRSMLGVNMLRVADARPHVLQRCLEAVAELTRQDIFRPVVSKTFPVTAISEAHQYLEKRQSIGKVAVLW